MTFSVRIIRSGFSHRVSMIPTPWLLHTQILWPFSINALLKGGFCNSFSCIRLIWVFIKEGFGRDQTKHDKKKTSLEFAIFNEVQEQVNSGANARGGQGKAINPINLIGQQHFSGCSRPYYFYPKVLVSKLQMAKMY